MTARLFPLPAKCWFPSRTSSVWSASGVQCLPPPKRLRLRDGRSVVVRPIRQSDADGLLQFNARLSPETRRSRFFTAGNTKRRVDAERLAAASGKHDCVLVATDPAWSREHIVAVAQLADYGDGVEAALVVADEYQGVGLGSELFRRLLDAGHDRGVGRVEATVLSGNGRILSILRQHDAKLGPSENGVVSVTIPRTAA